MNTTFKLKPTLTVAPLIAFALAAGCSAPTDDDSSPPNVEVTKSSASAFTPEMLDGKCSQAPGGGTFSCDLRDALAGELVGQTFSNDSGGLSFETKGSISVRDVIAASFEMHGPSDGDTISVRVKINAHVHVEAGYCEKRPTIAIHPEWRRHCDWADVYDGDMNIDARIELGAGCKAKSVDVQKSTSGASWDNFVLNTLWRPIIQGKMEDAVGKAASKQAQKWLGEDICYVPPPPPRPPVRPRPCGGHGPHATFCP
jgi:hypothetical protein